MFTLCTVTRQVLIFTKETLKVELNTANDIMQFVRLSFPYYPQISRTCTSLWDF